MYKIYIYDIIRSIAIRPPIQPVNHKLVTFPIQWLIWFWKHWWILLVYLILNSLPSKQHKSFKWITTLKNRCKKENINENCPKIWENMDFGDPHTKNGRKLYSTIFWQKFDKKLGESCWSVEIEWLT